MRLLITKFAQLFLSMACQFTGRYYVMTREELPRKAQLRLPCDEIYKIWNCSCQRETCSGLLLAGVSEDFIAQTGLAWRMTLREYVFLTSAINVRYHSTLQWSSGNKDPFIVSVSAFFLCVQLEDTITQAYCAATHAQWQQPGSDFRLLLFSLVPSLTACQMIHHCSPDWVEMHRPEWMRITRIQQPTPAF